MMRIITIRMMTIMINDISLILYCRLSILGLLKNCATPEGWGYGTFCYELLQGVGVIALLLCNRDLFRNVSFLATTPGGCA